MKRLQKDAIPVLTVVAVLLAVLILNPQGSITGNIIGINNSNLNSSINQTTNTTMNQTINLPPEQIQIFNNQTINQTTNINLSKYFIDPENQTIFYDINNLNNLNTTIKENTLTIKPTPTGTFTIKIYATDGEQTTTSNEFTITTPTTNQTTNETANINQTQNNTNNTNNNQTTNQTINTTQETNQTQNNTNNQTANNTLNNNQQTPPTTTPNTNNNQTINTTQETNQTTTPPTASPNTNNNQTNQTTNNNQTQNNTSTLNITNNSEIIINCNYYDPNLRPIECIEANMHDYYETENVFLTNKNRQPVARINPIGNLILTGNIIENSNRQPNPEDFKVTKLNKYFEEETIASIDSTTGNLYIKGTLHEEDFFLTPTSGAFIIQNKRNINLAYIDRNTGDLHLKGNLIQNK